MSISRGLAQGVLFVGCVSLGGLSIGCSCGREKSDKPAAAKVTVPVPPAIDPKVDTELFDELKVAAADCRVGGAQARVTCNGSKKNAIALAFNKGERSRVEALPTFIHALETGDEKLKGLAASILYASFRIGLGTAEEARKVTPGVAQELLKVALKLPSSSSMQAMPAATHAMMASGQAAGLYQALTDTVPVQVRTMSYRYLMVYGRLAAFEKVRELAKDPGAAVVLATIESPRNMRNWTSEEQASICPWAVGFLDDPRPPVAGNATAVLSNCSGDALDTLLTRLEKSLKDKQFSFIHSTALRDVCGDARKRRTEGATEKQCEKVRALQEKASRSTDVMPRVRAMTLSASAYTWPDEQSLQLAKQLSRAKEPDVARAASQVVTRLEPRLAKKK